ncbi:MAG: hypothetical protein H0U49_07495 [Parachlamydiaceae bacterium]|nr:hypothetical protein [Parachlamydiaceae bacterium]
MNFKSVTTLILLFFASAFVGEAQGNSEKEGSLTCNSQECQGTDASEWAVYPITFGHFDGVSEEENAKERIEISFPTPPEYVKACGLQSEYFTASDKDGVTFSVAALRLQDENFNLGKSVDFMAESIKRSSDKQFHGVICPKPNLKDSLYAISWIKNDMLSTLILIKSANFVYFLEVSSYKAAFQVLNLMDKDNEDEAYNIALKNQLRISFFANSLKINGVPMVHDALNTDE